MERLSLWETCKKIAADLREIGEKLGRRCFDKSKALGKRLLKGFKGSSESAKQIYYKLEERFAPVGRRWIASLVEWWERRGWPLILLRLGGNALLYLPLDLA